MMVEPRTLLIYRTEEGREPFTEWLNELKDKQARARIDARLARVEGGNFSDHKAVGEGVSELRLTYGQGLRVYYAQLGSTIVILLTGGTKHNQDADIKSAKEFWRDYRKRNATKEDSGEGAEG